MTNRLQVLRGNLAAICYAIAWGQCSEVMKAKVKLLSEYTKNAKANN